MGPPAELPPSIPSMMAARKKQTARNRPMAFQGRGARKPAANPTTITMSAVRPSPLSLQPRMAIGFPAGRRRTRRPEGLAEGGQTPEYSSDGPELKRADDRGHRARGLPAPAVDPSRAQRAGSVRPRDRHDVHEPGAAGRQRPHPRHRDRAGAGPTAGEDELPAARDDRPTDAHAPAGERERVLLA